MTVRYTIDVLASGQPRPYADHRYIARIKFEIFFAWLGNPNDERSKWVPLKGLDVEKVTKFLSAAPGIQFSDQKAGGWDWSLRSLKEIEEGTWEWYMTQPYTD